MMNNLLIAKTVKMVAEYLEAEGIMENNDSIRKRAEDWYNHTEIVDEETLAAVVLSGDYEAPVTYGEIQEIHNFFFPTEPIYLQHFSIDEIELALDDELWR